MALGLRHTLAVALAFWTAFGATSGLANPRGGAVRGGAAQIVGEGTGHVEVFQRSNSALLSWEQFNIEAGEKTTFHQPGADAVAINRTLQTDASRIFGSLVADGHVYLINPNGFLFGREATINTRAFLATTTVDGKELAERYGFDPSAEPTAGAKIENLGRIESGAGGFIYLIAPKVENGETGVIVSPEGQVEIAAGATVYLTDRADGHGLAVEYTAPAGGSAVNLGQIVADGGLVRVKAGLIQQAGVVEANSVRERNGQIELVASDAVVLESGSRTAATGGADASSDAGTIYVWADDTARVGPGAELDASASAQGADGGAIEVSAGGEVSLGGNIDVGGGTGGKGGELVVDPELLTVNDATQVAGAGRVLLSADQKIDVAATISLAGAGDPSDPRQSLTLRSGGDIEFQAGAAIREDGDGSKIWDVGLVAGADLAVPVDASSPEADLFALDRDRTGQLAGDVRLDGSGAGVQLNDGDLTVRTTGDLVLEDGSQLSNVHGAIDIEAGDSVRFRARQHSTHDTVIENGSGDIRVVAENDVLLQPELAPLGTIDPNVAFRGDAAIRTRGVTGTDADGNTTISDGGSILIWAKNGSVDAGLGNRWLEPGPYFGPDDPFLRLLGFPPAPDFDGMPVVRAATGDPNDFSGAAFEDGVLGIGTEAGGDVTVIAGQDITTRASNATLMRSAGTASGGGTSYDGAHIGSFGVPVSIQTEPLTGWVGAVDLPGAPQSHVALIAGGNLTGDFTVRNGVLSALAGYALPAGTTSVADLAGLSREALRAHLELSAGASSGNSTGWVGTLRDPITFEITQGSVDALAANGIALRTALNPSLALPPIRQQVLGYGSDDSLRLEAETGDVLLLGNEITPTSSQIPREAVLPPTLEIVTHDPGSGERPGDVVLLNDFLLAPSPTGNLSIEAAGKVRTANAAASDIPAAMQVSAEVGGTAPREGLTIPAGTRLRDPETGLIYTLTQEIRTVPAQPEREARVSIPFQAELADAGVTIPAGVRAVDRAGNVYVTQVAQSIPPLQQRVSSGQVRLAPVGGVVEKPFTVAINTEFVAPDGTVFVTTKSVSFSLGDLAKNVPVVARDRVGVDAAAGALQLADPEKLPQLASATNPLSTQRLPRFGIEFVATEKKLEPASPLDQILRLDTPVAGAFVVPGAVATASGGRNPPVFADVDRPGVAEAPVVGPVGLLPDGLTLEVLDNAFLPAGIAPGDVRVFVTGTLVSAGIRPVVFRNPADPGAPDPSPGALPALASADVWQRTSEIPVARIVQSDAQPVDLRSISELPADVTLERYLNDCHSGVACNGVSDPEAWVLDGTRTPILVGSGPLHLGDATKSVLHAGGGIERVAFTLAESASVTAGPLNPTVPPTTPSDIIDLELTTQHVNAGDETIVSAPWGDIAFASRPRHVVDEATGIAIELLGRPSSGVTVFGPGKLGMRAGVLDDGTASGLGGKLELSDNTLGTSRGISTAGNLPDRVLPEGGAAIDILTAGDIQLNRRGSIITNQGGDITIKSLAGGVDGGEPENFTGQRGIVTLFVPQGSNESLDSGGGSILVDVFGDFDIGKSAIATLAGGDITITSQDGSISGGTALPFGGASVAIDALLGFPTASYAGGGIFSTGKVKLEAGKDIDIGAGITGASIAIAAGGNINAGAGSISSSGNVSIDVGGTISGSISAGGSVTVSGGTVASGTSIAATGLVAGAGSVASNTGAGKVNSETSIATNSTASLAETSGVGTANSGPPRRGVMVEVTSECLGDDCDDEG